MLECFQKQNYFLTKNYFGIFNIKNKIDDFIYLLNLKQDFPIIKL